VLSVVLDVQVLRRRRDRPPDDAGPEGPVADRGRRPTELIDAAVPPGEEDGDDRVRGAERP
jgi:hypothetical protein